MHTFCSVLPIRNLMYNIRHSQARIRGRPEFFSISIPIRSQSFQKPNPSLPETQSKPANPKPHPHFNPHPRSHPTILNPTPALSWAAFEVQAAATPKNIAAKAKVGRKDEDMRVVMRRVSRQKQNAIFQRLGVRRADWDYRSNRIDVRVWNALRIGGTPSGGPS